MTAAMAFFSIALTLNFTGVRLSSLRLSDLRPTAVRSFMERRLTTASVPIVRYYDHLRFVYEVESSMRELRRTEGEDRAETTTASQAQRCSAGHARRVQAESRPQGRRFPHGPSATVGQAGASPGTKRFQ